MSGAAGFGGGTVGETHPIESRCAAEPIHTPGSVQPHGILLVADPARGMRLVAASANAAGLSGGALTLQQSLAELLGAGFAEELVARDADGRLDPARRWETTVVLGDGRAYEIGAHVHAGLVLIELEAEDPADAAVTRMAAREMQHAIAELRADEGSVEELARGAVRNIRLLTGYERVLVYRFDPDWNGQALAEDRVTEWGQSLLGLHFPASDIPSQARALYRVSPLRWVLSRDAAPVPLLADPDWEGGAIDLSHARIRSLSPIHLQYHRNLDVDGTMSLSIMHGPRLWGLVVCHHRRPHRPAPAQRAAAAALADAFALRIAAAERAGDAELRREGQHRLGALIAQLAQSDDLVTGLTAGALTARDLFSVERSAPGAAVVQGGAVALVGVTPPAGAVMELATWLREAAPEGEVFATACLPVLRPEWAAQAGVASGVLAAFLSADRADMLLWFRPEETSLVSWGGNPHKTPEAAMTPRLSFERWVEERRFYAEAWTAFDVELAGMLVHAITAVILRNARRVADLNEQLRQSQKMEAVGQLTGGIAHDFNNMLASITGSVELAQLRLAQGRAGEIDRLLTAARSAAARAASLTHRLLAFSRRQTLNPQPTDVNRLVASMTELVRSTMNPSIVVECVASAGLWSILCDANQLENAILNLALNARDAMPGGGRLTIEAVNARLEDDYAVPLGLVPGHYVAIAVSDTGTGMAPEVVQRAFEPFFTTKPLGEGTGLGLSMVYGFVRQTDGTTKIYSEPGHGTTVRIYLPRHEGPAGVGETAVSPPVSPARNSPLVLVVDDEAVLRMLVCEVLDEAGYALLEAGDGAEALRVLASPGRIDLLLTDIGLPGGMSGRQVAEAARAGRPGLPVLFMTGYAESAALSGGVINASTQVITKPFGMRALLEKVRGMVPG